MNDSHASYTWVSVVVVFMLGATNAASCLAASPIPEYQDVSDMRALTAGLDSEFYELTVIVGLVEPSADSRTVLAGWAFDARVPIPILGLTWESMPPPAIGLIDLMGVPSGIAVTCGDPSLGTAVASPKCWHPLAFGLAETLAAFEDYCPPCQTHGSDPRDPEWKAQVFPRAIIGYEEDRQPGEGMRIPFPTGNAIFLQVKGVGRGATPDEMKVRLFKRWLFPPKSDSLPAWETWANLMESLLLFLGDGEDTALAGEPPHPLTRMKALLSSRYDEANATVEALRNEQRKTTTPLASE